MVLVQLFLLQNIWAAVAISNRNGISTYDRFWIDEFITLPPEEVMLYG